MIKLLDLLKEELSDDNMYKITFQKGKYTIKKTTIFVFRDGMNLVLKFLIKLKGDKSLSLMP